MRHSWFWVTLTAQCRQELFAKNGLLHVLSLKRPCLGLVNTTHPTRLIVLRDYLLFISWPVISESDCFLFNFLLPGVKAPLKALVLLLLTDCCCCCCCFWQKQRFQWRNEVVLLWEVAFYNFNCRQKWLWHYHSFSYLIISVRRKFFSWYESIIKTVKSGIKKWYIWAWDSV